MRARTVSFTRRSLILMFALGVTAGSVLYARQMPDRTKAPTPGPVPVLKLPPLQKRVLTNGLPVWVVEMHEVPVVDVSLIVRGGTSADPVGKYGVATFTASMLNEGAGARTSLQLADAVDSLGASLTSTSGFDASTVRMHAPVSKLDAALPLMADVALRPTFPAAELERVRKARLTALVQTRDDAAQLASAAYSRLLFGPSHRFGTPSIGTTATNTAMTITDVKQYYASRYRPKNAHILVVGDVTTASILPKLERAFGAWTVAAAPAVAQALPTAPMPAARQIYLIDKPGAAQAQIRIGTVGVARSTPDYFVLDVLNTILGGSFTSRLNQNLREEHGYAYGASSSFSMRVAPGPFVSGAGVQTDKAAESLKEFFKELDGIHTPVPADELARARNLEALSFPASFETTSDMAGQLADLVVYNLPDTFFAEYVPKIQAVTTADLQRAAREHLPTDRFVVVVVGDLAKIEQPIRAANLVPVKVVTADDVLK